MQLSTVLSIATAVALVAAGPLDKWVNCKNIVPACNGGSIIGRTNCLCDGQKSVDKDVKGVCDKWTCPDDSRFLVCGGERTGCAFQ
ncbi:hypothetical protein RB594_009527 [Gaeumannomyces avenae]